MVPEFNIGIARCLILCGWGRICSFGTVEKSSSNGSTGSCINWAGLYSSYSGGGVEGVVDLFLLICLSIIWKLSALGSMSLILLLRFLWGIGGTAAVNLMVLSLGGEYLP